MNYNSEVSKAKDIISGVRNSGKDFRTDSIDERLIMTEVMVQTLWGLMEKQGVTREQLMEELQHTLDVRKEFRCAPLSQICPRCGKKMQIGNVEPFKAQCVYCDNELLLYPYTKYEPQLEEAIAEEPVKEPYNLEKDLNFDNWNNN